MNSNKNENKAEVVVPVAAAMGRTSSTETSTTTITKTGDHIANCPMCLDELPPKTNDYCKTSCRHEFHLSCLISYTVHTGLEAQNPGKDREIPCPLCRSSLYAIPKDLDMELLRMVSNGWYSKRAALIQKGAKYSATIQPGMHLNPMAEVGMAALHYAVRDGAPTKVIKEIYYAYPLALLMPDICGLTPLDLLIGIIECDDLKGRNYTPERANEVKEFLEKRLPSIEQ